ncbi:MAG: NERD domain-containing protein, partial [Polyangiaceae bacterium]
MHMIPATPYRTNSHAEMRVFDLLRAAAIDDHGTFTAYHSLNLTRHPSKRYGEIDFLLCGKPGIFVLEVKGGGVGVSDGKWLTSSHDGKSALKESPFRQAETAMHGLRNRLTDALPAGASQFAWGYGVVLPDVVFDVQGAEWEPWMLADTRGVHDFERWLKRLVSAWRSRDFKQPRPSDSELREMKHFLRPQFEKLVPLCVQAEHAADAIVQLTEDQMRWVDVVESNSRVLCSGGAGTGKTFLAMELAKRWAAAHPPVAIACQSPWLKSFLDSRLSTVEGLTVTTVEAIGSHAIDRFQALIVDEGQDLFHLPAIDRLDRCILGGFDRGRWCVFYDTNNQAGLYGPTEPDAIRFLESANPARVPLRTNCRNTEKILERVRSLLGADMGTNGAGFGPDVRQRTVASAEESARALEAEIDYVVHQGGISPGEVTILSPLPYPESSLARCRW